MRALISKKVLLARFVDFSVIALMFYLSCSLLSVQFRSDLLMHLVIYSSVILIAVRLAKRYSTARFSSSILKLMVGNALGLGVGACVVILLQSFFSQTSDLFIVEILSSVMAFFVLGTVAPVLKFESPLSH